MSELTKERIEQMRRDNKTNHGPAPTLYSYEGVTDGFEFEKLCELALRTEAAEAKLAEEKARQTIVARNLKDAWGAQVSALKERIERKDEALRQAIKWVGIGGDWHFEGAEIDGVMTTYFEFQDRLKAALTPPSKEA